MKKILHIFRTEKFTQNFIRFINKFFDEEEHKFLIFKKEINTPDGFMPNEKDYLKADNVTYVPRIQIELNKPSAFFALSEYDQIIYHGLFEYEVLLFFSNHRELYSKLFLYFWGGDIPLSGKLQEDNIKRDVIEHARGIITIIESDQKRIEELYHPSGDRYCASYGSYQSRQFISKYKKEIKHPHDDAVYVQIGNSATETNNHLEILHLLRKYKDEKIKIFLPLSYGNMDYAQRVVDEGDRIFGGKFIPILKMMAREDYIKYLSDIDVGIFNISARQQALGNIKALYKLESKLYMPKPSVLSEYFEKCVGVTVANIKQIETMTFNDFKEMPQEIRKKNALVVEEYGALKKVIRAWENVFHEVR